jgi:hypothetical protein
MIGFEYHGTRSKLTEVKESKQSNCQGFFLWMMDEMKLDHRYIQGQPRKLIDRFIDSPSTWSKEITLRGRRVPLTTHAALDEWIVKHYADRQLLVRFDSNRFFSGSIFIASG